MMMRIAFKMKLFEGFGAEYKRRHDEIWSELKTLLKEAGIRDYSIFGDTESNDLFACYTVEDEDNLKALHQKEVMQKWWSYMKDIMETNGDNSPVSIPLKEVFYLE